MAEEEKMVSCKFCGEPIPQKQLFRHWNEQHPEEAQEMRRRGGESRRKAAKKQHAAKPAAQPESATAATATKPHVKPAASLVEAAMLEFVGQSIQVPNTPAIVYGYFCAKKFGFNGSLSEFLQQVIDDFWQARGINFYEEVTGWTQAGSEISQQEAEQQPELAAEKV